MDKRKKDKENSKLSSELVTKGVSALADTTAVIAAPHIALPLLGVKYGVQLFNLSNKIFESRTNELTNELGAEKITYLLTENERTASLFWKVYTNYLVENIEEKRNSYLNFLKGIAEGKKISEELDNKFLAAISSLSNAEILVLERVVRNYDRIIIAAKDSSVAKETGIHTEDVVKSKILSDISNLSDEHLNSEIEKMLLRFGSLGLINVKTGRMNGTFYSLNDEGNLFIKLISGK